MAASLGRATWKGHLRFSLVSIPVKAYLDRIRREGARINRNPVCTLVGAERCGA